MKLESSVQAETAEYLARLLAASPDGEPRGCYRQENGKEVLFFAYEGVLFKCTIEDIGRAGT